MARLEDAVSAPRVRDRLPAPYDADSPSRRRDTRARGAPDGLGHGEIVPAAAGTSRGRPHAPVASVTNAAIASVNACRLASQA